jgi:D-tyrosyl-tRNA(Tyr) deacylase
MRAVVQRVKESSVRINQEIVGEIGKGLLVLLGVAKGDSTKDCEYLVNKIVNLRIFEDQHGKMNRSVLEVGGEMLVVSQFTLLGDCRKGRRPSFIQAAQPDQATELYEHFVKIAGDRGISVKTGQFRAMMEVALINDGPVTLILESNSS